MNKILLLFFILFSTVNVLAANKITYTEPCNDAKYVSINSNIIIGFDHQLPVEQNELSGGLEVTGTKSGHHEGAIMLTPDKKKIIFTPSAPFAYNENVSVKVTLVSFSDNSGLNISAHYSFSTSKQKVEWNSLMSLKEEMSGINNDHISPPELIISEYNDPAAGYIFSSPWYFNSAILIGNNNGTPFWSREFSTLCGDFKQQPNGHYTYFASLDSKHYELNTSYQIVNSYYCGNGYTTDLHELKVLNNGHALVMAYDPQVVDMSQIVAGGNPNAVVTGLIIQEIDENKNVVFQWRSWDHFQITDATHENLLDSAIDYVHGNAIEVDTDNNILISSRHMDEITKINRTTGQIMWRLGGKNNEFTFINDPIKFSHQHDIRRIANGNITLFDNGNFHSPQFSRAAEYSLNEVTKTATLVWQFRNTPDIFGPWGGNVQRLSNGNTFIGWGGASTSMSEVTPSGFVVFKGSFPANVYTYRAYKFDLEGNPTLINNETGAPEDFSLGQNFPNPFNPSTIISFSIPVKGNVELNVFDVLGRKVAELFNGPKEAGSHTVEFKADKLPSGIYFYTLNTENFSQTRKMILVK